MKHTSFMVVAGEISGDTLAAELVHELRAAIALPGGARRDGLLCQGNDGLQEPEQGVWPRSTPGSTLRPRFFGAGGPRMDQAGVELALDMTVHSVIGLSDVVRKFLDFRRIFHRLVRLAADRLPDGIVCVDFSGFNRRFAHAIRERVRRQQGRPLHNWNPKIIQYVSPQVWASREGRAYQMAADYNLLLCILPFEQAWYARKVPDFPVRFVGHPICDRYREVVVRENNAVPADPLVLLLPGSRRHELDRHLPAMIPAVEKLKQAIPGLRARMVLPTDTLLAQARAAAPPPWVELQTGALAGSLAEAHLAMASTGTVTLECAYFRVPTVAFYKTSWTTYQLGKRIVKVKYLSMPNLLADRVVFPEFVQDDATPENLFQAGKELLTNEQRRREIQARLGEMVSTLGGPGASRRAAEAILSLS